MPVDAEIPLSYDPKPLGPDPNQTMSMLQFAQQFRQNQRAEQSQNALKQILAAPDAFDPKTNLPSQKAIQRITQIDPQTGIKLQEESLDQQVQRAQIAHTQTEAGKARWDFATSVAGIGYDAYKDKKDAGSSEADAISAGQQARNAAISNNGGQISDDDAAGMISSPFDPQQAKALAQANKEYVTAKHDAVTEDVLRGNLGVKQADAGQPVTGGAPGATGGAATPEGGGSDDALTTWAKKLDTSENATGDPRARPIDPKTGKPMSSAMGNGQFTESTWLENAKQNHPEWVKAGLTDKQILALRGDPDTSLGATVDNAKKNAGILTADNIPVTGANLAIAHKAGPGDAPKIINAPPETPMANIVSPEVMHNLGIKPGTTAGQYVGGMVAQFGAAPLAIGGGSDAPQRVTLGKGAVEYVDDGNNKTHFFMNPSHPGKGALADGTPYTPKGNVTKAGTDAQESASGPLDMNDPGDKSYIESIANYHVRPPSSSRNPAQRKAIIEAVLKVNPEYQEARYDEASKALRDFGTGKQGDIARSLNVAIAHLGTFDKLVDAMHNGDVQLFNKIANKFAEETGSAVPTNLDTAKVIIGDEVAKSIVGGQNAQADREAAQAAFSRAKSTDQLKGASATVKQLMAGQVGGLRSQYERTTGAKDFDETFLNEDTRKELGITEGGKQGPKQAGGGKAKFEDGKIYVDSQTGKKAKFEGGKWIAVP